MAEKRDYYETLGVNKSADQQTIKKAYRKLAKKYHAKVIAFAEGVTKEANACNKEGIDAFFPILRNVCTLWEAMNPDNARENMTAATEQVFCLL